MHRKSVAIIVAGPIRRCQVYNQVAYCFLNKSYQCDTAEVERGEDSTLNIFVQRRHSKPDQQLATSTLLLLTPASASYII